MRIVSISSSRADVGVLSQVWKDLGADPNVDLHVLFTGMHMRDAQRKPAPRVENVEFHCGGRDLGGEGPASAAQAMSAITSYSASVIDAVAPDLVIVIGDRLDMLPAALSVPPFNIPLVHIHGGDQTPSAIDNDVRHALTKLSHLHCVADADAARRVNRMGEEPWRIHITGAPGLDILLRKPEMRPDAFAREVGLADIDSLRLVTVHPETRSARPDLVLDVVLTVLDMHPMPTLITAPNSDPGGNKMRAAVAAFAADKPWCRYIDTLGSSLYANAMRHAAVMVGNSSSGLIEAPLFKLPTINLGNRQEGRPRGDNVIDCPAETGALVRCLEKAEQVATGLSGHSPYGDGKSAPRIVAAILGAPDREELLYKTFADTDTAFEAPWAH